MNNVIKLKDGLPREGQGFNSDMLFNHNNDRMVELDCLKNYLKIDGQKDKWFKLVVAAFELHEGEHYIHEDERIYFFPEIAAEIAFRADSPCRVYLRHICSGKNIPNSIKLSAVGSNDGRFSVGSNGELLCSITKLPQEAAL